MTCHLKFVACMYNNTVIIDRLLVYGKCRSTYKKLHNAGVTGKIIHILYFDDGLLFAMSLLMNSMPSHFLTCMHKRIVSHRQGFSPCRMQFIYQKHCTMLLLYARSCILVIWMMDYCLSYPYWSLNFVHACITVW